MLPDSGRYRQTLPESRWSFALLAKKFNTPCCRCFLKGSLTTLRLQVFYYFLLSSASGVAHWRAKVLLLTRKRLQGEGAARRSQSRRKNAQRNVQRFNLLGRFPMWDPRWFSPATPNASWRSSAALAPPLGSPCHSSSFPAPLFQTAAIHIP